MTLTAERVWEISPDEYPHQLLGYLGQPIKNLSPRAATALLHSKIASCSNNDLERIAENIALFLVKSGHITLREVSDLTLDCVSKLISIRYKERDALGLPPY